MVPQFPRWTADFSWLSSKIQSCLHLVLELDKYFGRFEMNLGKHLLVGCSSCSLPRFSNTCFLKNRWCSWFSQVKFLFVGQKAKHGIKVKNLLFQVKSFEIRYATPSTFMTLQRPEVSWQICASAPYATHETHDSEVGPGRNHRWSMTRRSTRY